MVDHPDDDASLAEIARWMEEDFWESVARGVEEAVEDNDSEE